MSTLQDKGYIERDPSIPRGIKIRRDPVTGFTGERGEVRYIPLVGQIAAGGPILADGNIEESLPLPTSLTGNGELFMVKVKGDSMIDAEIMLLCSLNLTLILEIWSSRPSQMNLNMKPL
jgi:repressor LexA